MRDMILEMVDELLDSEGDVVIGGLTFARSAIVRKLDPVAYSMIVDDIVNAEIEDLRYDLDRMDAEVDAEEIEDTKERIESLENFTY